MSTKMTVKERETFLAEVHVAIAAIPMEGRGSLAVPVWYGYEPGGEVWFATGRNSMKGKLIAQTKRISLTVQTEEPPYQYVMVEGPISIDTAEPETHERPLAHRYLGQETGDAYMAANSGGDNIVVRMTPERWLSADYGKDDLISQG